ncbi:MAG: hypothetical protein DRP11_04770 [Candidatus Aenigmatarchaeota archaeon]|nr:MAG: hypothetical protein DRP11_04770 [Candidatus Aenigmarchaeota archaeon]
MMGKFWQFYLIAQVITGIFNIWKDGWKGVARVVIAVLALLAWHFRAFIIKKVTTWLGVLQATTWKATAAVWGLRAALMGLPFFALFALAGLGAGAGAPRAPGGGGIPAIPATAYAQGGGFVARGGLAVIHPGELILPAGAWGGGLGNVTVNIQSAIIREEEDIRSLADEISMAVADRLRRRGKW